MVNYQCDRSCDISILMMLHTATSSGDWQRDHHGSALANKMDFDGENIDEFLKIH